MRKEAPQRFVIADDTNWQGDDQGDTSLGNRQRSLLTAFLVAVLTKRAFIVKSGRNNLYPPFYELFRPNQSLGACMDWHSNITEHIVASSDKAHFPECNDLVLDDKEQEIRYWDSISNADLDRDCGKGKGKGPNVLRVRTWFWLAPLLAINPHYAAAMQSIWRHDAAGVVFRLLFQPLGWVEDELHAQVSTHFFNGSHAEGTNNDATSQSVVGVHIRTAHPRIPVDRLRVLRFVRCGARHFGTNARYFITTDNIRSVKQMLRAAQGTIDRNSLFRSLSSEGLKGSGSSRIEFFFYEPITARAKAFAKLKASPAGAKEPRVAGAAYLAVVETMLLAQAHDLMVFTGSTFSSAAVLRAQLPPINELCGREASSQPDDACGRGFPDLGFRELCGLDDAGARAAQAIDATERAETAEEEGWSNKVIKDRAVKAEVNDGADSGQVEPLRRFPRVSVRAHTPGGRTVAPVSVQLAGVFCSCSANNVELNPYQLHSVSAAYARRQAWRDAGLRKTKAKGVTWMGRGELPVMPPCNCDESDAAQSGSSAVGPAGAGAGSHCRAWRQGKANGNISSPIDPLPWCFVHSPLLKPGAGVGCVSATLGSPPLDGTFEGRENRYWAHCNHRAWSFIDHAHNQQQQQQQHQQQQRQQRQQGDPALQVMNTNGDNDGLAAAAAAAAAGTMPPYSYQFDRIAIEALDHERSFWSIPPAAGLPYYEYQEPDGGAGGASGAGGAVSSSLTPSDAAPGFVFGFPPVRFWPLAMLYGGNARDELGTPFQQRSNNKYRWRDGTSHAVWMTDVRVDGLGANWHGIKSALAVALRLRIGIVWNEQHFLSENTPLQVLSLVCHLVCSRDSSGWS
jgi:hypothetical protein